MLHFSFTSYFNNFASYYQLQLFYFQAIVYNINVALIPDKDAFLVTICWHSGLTDLFTVNVLDVKPSLLTFIILNPVYVSVLSKRTESMCFVSLGSSGNECTM